MRYLNNTQNYDNFSIFPPRISIICTKQIYYWSITFFRIFHRHHSKITNMIWPPQSPDLNQTEQIW
jgi:hypothetical protein